MFEEYLATVPYDFETVRDADGYITSTCTRADPMPPEIGLVIGDAIHNLRSSLDAVVYSLATRHLGRTPTQSESPNIQFPIVDDGKTWVAQEKRWLSMVSADARALIASVQPFSQPEWGECLSQLRDFSNSDKHRRVNVVLASPEMTTVLVTADGGQPIPIPGSHLGPLSVGTRIAHWKFPDEVLPLGATLSFQPLVLPGMEFDPATYGDQGSVFHFLVSAHNAIRDRIFPPLDAILAT